MLFLIAIQTYANLCRSDINQETKN